MIQEYFIFILKIIQKNLRFIICIGNSMICCDIWQKYHERYFEIVIRNFMSRWASEI